MDTTKEKSTTFWKNTLRKIVFHKCLLFSMFQMMTNPLDAMPYYPAVTKVLARIFREHDIIFAPRSTGTLKSLLGSNKDDTPMLKKSGIYMKYRAKMIVMQFTMEKQSETSKRD